MPTYEYECTKCNHAFEEVAPITSAPRQRCPRCRGKVIRLISGGSGIVFKGSGFYVNDSRPKPATSGKSSSPTTEAPATPAPAANDSKPAPADKT